MENLSVINYLSEEYQDLNSRLLRSSGGETAVSTLIILNGASEKNKSAILRDISRATGKCIRQPGKKKVTEAILKQVFHETENNRLILFFDEADALFGERTKVKDAHDKYANIEVSYLLQEIEVHRGIVMLATRRNTVLHRALNASTAVVIEFPWLKTWFRKLTAALSKVT